MPDPLKVECPHCSGSLKLKDRSADGKKVRCPKCQEVFKVQLPEEDDLDVLDDLDDLTEDFGSEEDFEEEPVPKKSSSTNKKTSKKKRKGGSPIPWAMIGIAAAVLFFVGGVGVLVSQFSGGAGTNKIDMTYLLADADAINHFKVKEFLESPLMSGLMSQPQVQQMLNAPSGNQIMNFREMISITAGSQVDNLSQEMARSMSPFANRNGPAPVPAQTHTVVVVRNSVPFALEKLNTNVSKATPITHNGQTYHKRTAQLAGGLGMGSIDCYYFPEPTIMVMAMEADMKRVIDQGKTQVRRREFDFINPGMTLLMALISTKPSNPNAPSSAPASQPQLQAFERAFNKSLRSLAAGVKITDRMDLEMLLMCADAAGAGEMKTATEGMVTELKQQFEKSKQMLQLIGMEDVIGLADKSLASIKVEQTGTMVAAVGTIPSELKTVGESLVKKMGGMGMGMGSGIPPATPAGLGGPPGTSGGLPAGFDPSQLPPGAFPAGAPPAAGAVPPTAVPPTAVPPGAPANP